MGDARGVRDAGRTRPRKVWDAVLARLLALPLGRSDYRLTRDVRVPMRDGIELLTDVYRPVGESRGTLLIRTPYGRTGPIADLTARVYAGHGFLVVNQSCRGTSGSGGCFEPFANELADGADAVAWLSGQPWFGGRFAVVGPSYLGFTAWAIMVAPPPALATAVIAITAHDNHWVVHGSGAFALEQMLSLLDGFGHQDRGMLGATLHTLVSARALRRSLDEMPLIRAQDTLLAGTGMPYAEWLTAPDPGDPVWRTTRLGAALDRIDVPVLLQSGWQDRFTEQQFEEYARLSGRGVPVALTVGDWTHVEAAGKGWGLLTRETLDWLDAHLGEDRELQERFTRHPVRIQVTGTKAEPPSSTRHPTRARIAGTEGQSHRSAREPARVRITGTRGQTPRSAREPARVRITGTRGQTPRSTGTRGQTPRSTGTEGQTPRSTTDSPVWRVLPSWPPATTERVLYLLANGGLTPDPPEPDAGASRFGYDPADPTPAVGGRVVTPARAGRRDNRALEARPDVLTFTSAELTEPLEVLGRPVVRLAHGTDNPHVDLFVRLCEVAPDGRSTNLSDGFVRLPPEDANGLVSIELESLAHRFAAGTRLRLQVSGGAHPRFARNLGTGEDPATGTMMASSRRTIGHGPDGSQLILPCG